MPVLGITTDRLIELWPGLPAAWLRGKLSGLLIALGFAIVLESALLTSLVWPLWHGPVTNTVVWFCVALYWVVGAVPQVVRGSLGFRKPEIGEVQRLDLFRQAQTEYLTGNWFQAEQRLQELLKTDPTDTDVQLMIATLYRRLNRKTDALRHLELVTVFDRNEKWGFEVSQEHHRIRESRPPLAEIADQAVKNAGFHAANQSGAA